MAARRVQEVKGLHLCDRCTASRSVDGIFLKRRRRQSRNSYGRPLDSGEKQGWILERIFHVGVEKSRAWLYFHFSYYHYCFSGLLVPFKCIDIVPLPVANANVTRIPRRRHKWIGRQPRSNEDEISWDVHVHIIGGKTP